MDLLIQSIAELRQYVSFSGDLSYPTLVPALRSAQALLARYVGPALLTELATDPLSDDQQRLLPYACAPMASLALLNFSNAGNVRLTDIGVMRTKTADSGDAFEWQLERIVLTLKNDAFDGIENLLRYLEEQLDAFPSYASTEVYTQQKNQLIGSAAVFSQYYDIGSSRLIFQTLSASMRTAERTVRGLLGTTLTGLLGEEDLTDTQTEQLDAARRALVYLTIARALREKLVSISQTGVQVNGISIHATLNYKQAASDKQLQTSILYFDREAALFLSELAALLAPVPTTLPPPGSTGQVVLGTKIISF